MSVSLLLEKKPLTEVRVEFSCLLLLLALSATERRRFLDMLTAEDVGGPADLVAPAPPSPRERPDVLPSEEEVVPMDTSEE
jgi:hypothetical protein